MVLALIFYQLCQMTSSPLLLRERAEILGDSSQSIKINKKLTEWQLERQTYKVLCTSLQKPP